MSSGPPQMHVAQGTLVLPKAVHSGGERTIWDVLRGSGPRAGGGPGPLGWLTWEKSRPHCPHTSTVVPNGACMCGVGGGGMEEMADVSSKWRTLPPGQGQTRLLGRRELPITRNQQAGLGTLIQERSRRAQSLHCRVTESNMPLLGAPTEFTHSPSLCRQPPPLTNLKRETPGDGVGKEA